MRGEKSEEAYPDASRTVKADWPWVNPTYTLKIEKAPSAIKRVEIDPSMRMADINRDNNVMDIQAQMSDTTNAN
jgi:hypothetical protein